MSAAEAVSEMTWDELLHRALPGVLERLPETVDHDRRAIDTLLVEDDPNAFGEANPDSVDVTGSSVPAHRSGGLVDALGALSTGDLTELVVVLARSVVRLERRLFIQECHMTNCRNRLAELEAEMREVKRNMRR